MIGGLLFTVIMLAASLAIAPVEVTWRVTFWGVMAVSLAHSLLLAGLALSALPARLTAGLLKRLKIPADATAMLPRGEFFRALLAKEASFAFQLIEVYAIFITLGISPTAPDIVLTAALLAASASVFFMMPQGLGVNEAGVSLAFSMLGIAAPQAIAFGLIRRARIIVWTLLGVVLHLFWTRRRGNDGASGETPEAS